MIQTYAFFGVPMRVVQKKAKKGSQKWLQWVVNQNPSILNDLISPKLGGAAKIIWLSPLVGDGFAEYRDGQFLKRIGAENLAPKLAKFWPRRGPQWDGLALSDAGDVDVLLIEGKAHIGELCSPAAQASSQSSRKLIQKSLRLTASYLHAQPRAPWSRAFYQLANRLAHLYFLRKHGVKAWLVLVNFVGDEDMNGPKSEAEWNAAYQVVWHVLGVPKKNKLAPYLIEIFPDAEGIHSSPKAQDAFPRSGARGNVSRIRQGGSMSKIPNKLFPQRKRGASEPPTDGRTPVSPEVRRIVLRKFLDGLHGDEDFIRRVRDEVKKHFKDETGYPL